MRLRTYPVASFGDSGKQPGLKGFRANLDVDAGVHRESAEMTKANKKERICVCVLPSGAPDTVKHIVFGPPGAPDTVKYMVFGPRAPRT